MLKPYLHLMKNIPDTKVMNISLTSLRNCHRISIFLEAGNKKLLKCRKKNRCSFSNIAKDRKINFFGFLKKIPLLTEKPGAFCF